MCSIWGDGADDLALPETYVNWNIRPALGGGTDLGNFVYNATAPDGFGFPDAFPPQFSSRTDQTITNNFAAELVTYLDLPAGLTRLGVNSDDGFRVTCGLNPRERYVTNKVILLGQFEGGRGAADSLFDINVAEAGIYPIRVLWYQGGGDANIELFHLKPNGTRILINDIASGWKASNVESIKAFRSATVPRSAVVDWLQPAPNAVNVPTNAVIQPMRAITFRCGETSRASSELSSTTSSREMIAWAEASFSRRVCAAGVIGTGTLAAADRKAWDAMLEINLHATIELMRAALPHLEAAGGCVVNLSSVAGIRAFPGILPYAVSKAAVEQLTRCAALELGPRGVRVNAVSPGVVVTELHRRGYMDEATYAAFLEHSKETHPLGRVGQADEVADAIVFLASPRAAWITGVCLPVDGGRSQTCLR